MDFDKAFWGSFILSTEDSMIFDEGFWRSFVLSSEDSMIFDEGFWGSSVLSLEDFDALVGSDEEFKDIAVWSMDLIPEKWWYL